MNLDARDPATAVRGLDQALDLDATSQAAWLDGLQAEAADLRPVLRRILEDRDSPRERRLARSGAPPRRGGRRRGRRVVRRR